MWRGTLRAKISVGVFDRMLVLVMFRLVGMKPLLLSIVGFVRLKLPFGIFPGQNVQRRHTTPP
jgi:hypothetical protein